MSLYYISIERWVMMRDSLEAFRINSISAGRKPLYSLEDCAIKIEICCIYS